MNLYGMLTGLHIASVLFWLAALLYLPRLFVYHAEAGQDSDFAATFQTMERRLLRGIASPALIAALVFGIALVFQGNLGGWFLLKLPLVCVLIAFHILCARWYKQLEAKTCIRGARFFRRINEIPAVLAVVIILLATIKPF